eukprot:7844-Rhodomonas_salina.2
MTRSGLDIDNTGFGHGQLGEGKRDAAALLTCRPPLLESLPCMSRPPTTAPSFPTPSRFRWP